LKGIAKIGSIKGTYAENVTSLTNADS